MRKSRGGACQVWEPKMMISVPFSRPDGLICLSRPSQPERESGNLSPSPDLEFKFSLRNWDGTVVRKFARQPGYR